jgi:hypothetical protein
MCAVIYSVCSIWVWPNPGIVNICSCSRTRTQLLNSTHPRTHFHSYISSKIMRTYSYSRVRSHKIRFHSLDDTLGAAVPTELLHGYQTPLLGGPARPQLPQHVRLCG